MANPEHLKILEQGVEVWNTWRKENPQIIPELRSANLVEVNLNGADLSDAMLAQSRFCGATLHYVNFSRATLMGADFNSASLCFSRMVRTCLVNTDFSAADLGHTTIFRCELDGTIFRWADFYGTVFRDCVANKITFSGATLAGTTFANSDLSRVLDIESAEHQGPSTIGIDTLYKSQGRIPDQFLRDAGCPEEIIEIARSIRCGPAIQWHSCFISYSNKNGDFAERLHSRMRGENMRVWFAPEDMKGGDKLHEQLFRAIQIHDKLLLVLSEESIQSEWVMTEIRKAREVERKEKRRKLFPIRLVDFETLSNWTCFDADSGKDLAVELREYFIPDFSNWKDQDAFEKAFDRLQKDLKADL